MHFNHVKDDDIDKDCKIQNNSSYGLVVLDAFNDDDNSTKIIFEQTLKLLDPKNAKIIPNGSSDSVVLDDYTKDPTTGKKIYSMLYELILVQSNTLFPIKNLPEMMSFDTNSYPGISVSKDDSAKMNSAYQFHQMLAAYPTSNLSSDFNKAMQKAGEGKAPDIEKIMAEFFANTKQFQNVDMNSYSAVLTYMETFAYVWAAGQKSYTYYIYSVSDTTDKKAAPTYEGCFTLTRSSVPNVADPSDSSSGYTCTFTDAKNQSKTLYYAGGQFVDDKDSDITEICLKGSFSLKSSLTYSSDDKIIIPVLIGRIGSKSVLGSYAKQDGSGSESSWYVFWHPQSFQAWMNLFLNLMGILFALFFLAQGLNWMVKAFNKLVLKARQKAGSDRGQPDESDVDGINEKLKSVNEINKDLAQKMLDNINNCEPTEVFAKERWLEQRKQQLRNLVHGKEALQKTLLFIKLFEDCPEMPEEEKIESTIIENRLDSQKQITLDRVSAQKDLLSEEAISIQNIAELEITPQIEEAASKLKEVEGNVEQAEKLAGGDQGELNQASDLLTNNNLEITEIDTTLTSESQRLADKLSDEAKDQIDTANEKAKDVKAFEKQAQDDAENMKDGSVDEDVEPGDFPIID